MKSTKKTDLAGSLKNYAFKDKSIDQIRKIEKKAVGVAIEERYLKKRERAGKLSVVSVWSKQQFDEFNKTQKVFSEVDADDWK